MEELTTEMNDAENTASAESELVVSSPKPAKFGPSRRRNLVVGVMVLVLGLLVVRSINLQSQLDDIVSAKKLNDIASAKKFDDIKKALDSTSLYAEPKDLELFIDEVSQSIVDITCGDGGGTGFAYVFEAIEDRFKTFVVTNHHVIEECIDNTDALSVTHGGEKAIKTDSKLYVWDEENDLAIIKIVAELPTLPDTEYFASPGWWTMAIGNPGTDDGFLYNATTFGHIVGVEDKYWNYTSAVINRGNSGGPLVNSRGELIGINSYRYANEDKGLWNIAVDAAIFCKKLLECSD